MTDNSTVTNQERAARTGHILARLRGGNDLHTSLVHLLADAMHWCDANGEDFHWVLTQACRHYFHELNDMQEDELRMIP